MTQAVQVAGYGLVTPLGNDLAAFDAALFGGVSGVRAEALTVAGMDPTRVPVARVVFDEAAVRTPSRVPADRGTAMALAAAEAAVRHAGLDTSTIDRERLGVFWGSGMAGAITFDSTCHALYTAQRRMRPTTVVTVMPNAPVAELGLRFGAQGAALAYACACASSAVAIGEALRAIRGGWLDVAVVGGSEAMLTPAVITGWNAMRVLAALPEGSDGHDACRPFSEDRSGFAIGEGAAALVLESEAHARARGASGHARLSGYATNCDGSHITNPDSEGQMRVLRAALRDAGLQPSDIGYINAHGTATTAGDAAEARSVAAVFGDSTPVSSTKSLHGHLLGAGAAVELVSCLRALHTRQLPATAHLVRPDPAFGINLVRGDARPAPALRHVLSSSFAFGGTNAVLIASQPD